MSRGPSCEARSGNGVPGKCTYVVQVHCDMKFLELLFERLDYTKVNSKYCVLYRKLLWETFILAIIILRFYYTLIMSSCTLYIY
jgi:hypothetical protein